MRRSLSLLRPLLALALVTAVRADDPGVYERGRVEWKMKEFDSQLGEIMDRFTRWTAEKKLDDEQSRSQLIAQCESLMRELLENYSKAIAAGMTAGDPIMTAAKAKIDAALPKLAQVPWWTCWRADEPWIEELDQLDNARRVAEVSHWEASQGKPDEARKTWEGVDRIMEQLLRESKNKPDTHNERATANLDQNPSYKRTKEELERLKKENEVIYGQVDGKRDQTCKEWKTLQDAIEMVQKGGNGHLRNALSGRSNCSAEEVQLLEEFEKSVAPKIKPIMEAFAAKYPATDKEALWKMKGDIFGDTWRDYESKYSLNSDVAGEYHELTEMCAAPAKIRSECAGDLGEQALRDLGGLGDYSESAITNVMIQINQKVELGMRFDPKNEKIMKAKETMAPREAELRAGIEKATDAARMPASITDFKGPGTVPELEKAAIEFFNESSDWGKAENPYIIQAIAITGQWASEDKNLIGETVQWCVDYSAAFTRGKEGEPGIAYIYDGRIMTKNERGVAKAPPFDGYSHGDSVKMRIANLPGGGFNAGGGGGGGFMGGGSTGGIGGQYFWLGLVLVNILAGLLAAGPLLRVKVAQLEPVYAGLAPLQGLVGVGALGVGVVCFLRATLLYFSPHGDLLPQLSAILAGLFLGKEILLKKPDASAAPAAPAAPAGDPAAAGNQQKVEAAAAAAADNAQKAALAAQELLIKHREKIEALEKVQVPIGIACLVLGLLHLLAPGAPLF